MPQPHSFLRTSAPPSPGKYSTAASPVYYRPPSHDFPIAGVHLPAAETHLWAVWVREAPRTWSWWHGIDGRERGARSAVTP
jgi:hypothetical protein